MNYEQFGNIKNKILESLVSFEGQETGGPGTKSRIHMNL